MPADLTGRTWVITPGGFVLPTTLYSANVKVGTVYWNNPAAPGDFVIIQEANGKEIVRFRCEVANISQQQRHMRWWGGIRLVQLDSGTLEIETF